MTKMCRICAAALLFCLAGAASATHDGNKLNDWSNAADRVEQGRSAGTDAMETGFFLGMVSATAEALSDQRLICARGAQLGQIVAVVKKYTRDHPEQWSWRAIDIIHLALAKAFPCSQ